MTFKNNLELHKDEVEMLDAAVQVQIKDEEQEKLKKLMNQPEPSVVGA